jgi:hypothetical protein
MEIIIIGGSIQAGYRTCNSYDRIPPLQNCRTILKLYHPVRIMLLLKLILLTFHCCFWERYVVVISVKGFMIDEPVLKYPCMHARACSYNLYLWCASLHVLARATVASVPGPPFNFVRNITWAIENDRAGFRVAFTSNDSDLVVQN